MSINRIEWLSKGKKSYWKNGKAIERTEKLLIEQNGYRTSWYHDKLWHIMKYHNIFVIMTYHEMSWQNMTFCHKNKIKTFFVAKTHNYDIFVAKIYDYALIDSFWGSAGLIDSPTSYATLISTTKTDLLAWLRLLWKITWVLMRHRSYQFCR